ncbi:MAG: ATP-binding protein [Hyphomonas sp.]|uniref:ATP-binding protein n=1 Tax=Hyphomonas sp. TaxID=87 RepID=UPI003526CE85
MTLVRIEEISQAIEPVSPEMTCAAALGRFQAEADLFALPVHAKGAIGLLTRAAIMEALAAPEGRFLHATRPIKSLLVKSPMVAAAGTTAGVVARTAAYSFPMALSEGLIVTEQEAYIGLVSPQALLRAVADENAGRAKTLATAARRLEKAKADMAATARDKADFLAFVGHEIRTPLTGILGVADLLREKISGHEPKRLARTISESGHQLERLLTDLLDLSRLEAGRMPVNPVPFDLNDFAKQTRETWQPRSDGKRLDLRLKVSGETPRIEGDALRLRQVLFNLISNALKFTESGHVDVDLSTFEHGDALRLRMRVADTGTGISDADKARLFEAFEQASAETVHRHGGTGLGLAIARSLTAAMKGTIALADNPGGGCIFTVEIPVEKAGPRLVSTAPPVRTERPTSGKFELGRLLVVEDHSATALVITEALRGAGWKVDHAESAEDGLARAVMNRYQLILTDFHLPGANGDYIVRSLRGGNGLNVATPVVAVTADLTDERRALCRSAGFAALIAKPIRPRDLIATLADILMALPSGQTWAQVG